MKTIIKTTILALTLILMASSGFASDEGRFIHGIVIGKDGNVYYVNESNYVTMTYETLYYDSRGEPLVSPFIGVGEWLYIEGSVDNNNRVEAESVYLLPDYISRRDRHKYPFIQIP